MNQESKIIISKAISDVGYWQWWDEVENDYMVEFGGVLMYNETKKGKQARTSSIAIGFFDNAFLIFLDNDEVNDWYDLLHEDAINPYDIDSSSNERDGFTIMHEIGHIRLGHKEESDLADKMANHYAGFSLVPSPLYAG